jgi:molybdopterin/thiamine biosynthesis adenylyltransferase
MVKKIAIIGAGGINSWSIRFLSEILNIFYNEIPPYIKIFDNDIVEEKNIKRFNQNYDVEDLMFNKAEVLSKKYNLDFEDIFITEENINDKLIDFDDIIIGVDNHKTRQLLYNFAITNKKFLLDMRAQGTQIAYIIVDNNKTIDYYNEKYFNNKEIMEKKGSCQLKKDIETDHIENGNKIISFFCIYGIYLKHLRNEKIYEYEWSMVY